MPTQSTDDIFDDVIFIDDHELIDPKLIVFVSNILDDPSYALAVKLSPGEEPLDRKTSNDILFPTESNSKIDE